MTKQLYPLKFEPILKERIWGGQKLKSFLNKSSKENNIGESWEISDVEGNTSVIINGELKGMSLKEVLNYYKSDVIGKKNHEVFQGNFPLLIKFIDARTDLSIQLHPNDDLAGKRHNSYGKTEMWYVMQADQDAKLMVGFNQKVSPEKYLKHFNDKKLREIMNIKTVEKGDTFFIEAGRVHAIGGGVLLAEIQQSSDITYRIYDWDRVDNEGNPRELHNDLALDAIDFDMKDDFTIKYDYDANQSNKMVHCPYFKTNYLPLNGKLKIRNDKDSFMIYICVEGNLIIKTDHYSLKMQSGETVLIPAMITDYVLSSVNAKLLEVYI